MKTELSSHQTISPRWPDVVLTAEVENELFTNVRLITIKSELLSKAEEEAINWFMRKNQNATESDIVNKTQQILLANKIQMYESVRITEEEIVVYINSASIDDETIWRSFDLIYKAIENGGYWISDDPISYFYN